MSEKPKCARGSCNPRQVVRALLLSGVVVGCVAVPESIKRYAAELPARADGQYASIQDDEVKRSLILKDAMLQCRIDEADKPEDFSAACDCAKSSAQDWATGCKGWLGNHVPKKAAAPAPAPTPEPPASSAAPAPAPEASAPATQG